MLSRRQSNEQDETNCSGEIQPKMSKKRDLGKKRAPSPKVSRGLRKKIQKFLQGSGDYPTFDTEQSPVEIEDDMFICGIKRDPPSHECGVSTQRSFKSHTKTCTSTFMGQVELNSEGNVMIPCIKGKKEVTDHAMDSVPDYVDGRGAMDNKQHESQNKEEDARGGGSSTIVEHILKELQGINKIQEEISDLRQYLTSVSGSVDEVSCCVDAVLMEIEEMYSVGAVGNPSPRKAHQRSSGRLTPVALSQSRNTSPVKHKKLDKDESRTPKARSNMSGWDAQTHYRNVPRRSKLLPESSGKPSRVEKSCYSHRERVYMQEFASTSSLSSGHSSNSRDQGSYHSREPDQQSCGWRTSEMQLSVSGEGGWSGDTGWSEDDYCSCQNSADELENDAETWYRYNGDEASSTPGHSSRSSSEHLSLLFGSHNDPPSTSSSIADWRHPKKQTPSDVACDFTSNCMYSRSSGYHTMDAYADESCSGPSRSLSCSTVGMTDCDDTCQNPDFSCERCISQDHLDMEWTEGVFPSVSAGHYDPDYSENTDTEESQPPNVNYDVVKISKAMLTFQSALRGALMNLDTPEPQSPNEETKSVVSSASNANELEECTLKESDIETLKLSESPKRDKVSFNGKNELGLQNQWRCSQSFNSLVSTPSTVSPSHTPTESCSVDHLDTLTDQKPSNLQCIPESSLNVHPSSANVDSDKASIIPGNSEINPEGIHSELETDVSAKQVEHSLEPALVDPHHQKCLANIERVLKEKRHRHRLSRIANASKSTFSEEDFKQGTVLNPEIYLYLWVQSSKLSKVNLC